MALIGGAGNPTGGSNPAGTGSTVSYIGEHVYAYSSQISTLGSQAYTELLGFTTAANSYIVGNISMFGPVDSADPTSGAASNFRVSFNGEIIFYVNLETVSEDHPGQAVVPLLIPSSTTVLIETNASASGWNPSCFITGRVYA
jgi:hypothetical protein